MSHFDFNLGVTVDWVVEQQVGAEDMPLIILRAEVRMIDSSDIFQSMEFIPCLLGNAVVGAGCTNRRIVWLHRFST